MSGRGVLAVTFSMIFANMIMPRIAVDGVGPCLDAGVIIAPFSSRWSPFVGVGAHISFAELGIGKATTTMGTMNGQEFNHAEVYGRQVRGEIGAQYASRVGFTTELGLAMMVYEKADGESGTQVMPILHFGWLW